MCGVARICQHQRKRSECKECGGSGICQHQRRRSNCKQCGGARITASNSVRGANARSGHLRAGAARSRQRHHIHRFNQSSIYSSSSCRRYTRRGLQKKFAAGVGSVKDGDSLLYLVGACSVHSARHSVSICARTRTATHATHGFFPCRSFGASQAATAWNQILKKDNTPCYSHSTPQGDPLLGVRS